MKIPSHEELLLVRCRRFETEAIKTLEDLYGRRVYGLLRSILGTRSASAHNLMISAFSDTIRENVPFNMEEPFLVTAVRKLIAGLPSQVKNLDLSASWPGLDRQRALVFEALSALPWRERVLLLLRDQMDFDYDEIASILGRSVKNLKTELQQVRLNFRTLIEKFLMQRKG